MKSLYLQLADQLFGAVSSLYPSIVDTKQSFLTDLTPATQAAHGDYQYNGAMKIARMVKKAPREVAQEIVHAFTQQYGEKLVERIEIAGPGFINLTLNTEALADQAQLMVNDPHLGVQTERPERIVVDFSSPNIAKEMHVGHLRSTIIGDAIARLFEFLGHNVLRLNHIGDWGTQFGMLIAYIKQEILPSANLQDATLPELMAWYRASKELFDADATFKKIAQQEVVALQGGDEQSRQIWGLICDISRRGYQEIYDLLDIKLVDRGESFYNPFLADIVQELTQRGVLTESEGAKVIFLDGFVTREGALLPLIVQKSDAGYNYATTDLAALKHRISIEKADRIIYVTDAGQAQHFQMVFQAAEKAGLVNRAKVHLHHVPFGLVLAPSGKKFKTRSGDTERLMDLLETAIEKSSELVAEKNPDMPLAEREKLARNLAIAALKYADLSGHRVSDYVFSYERMLRFDGNTAPFILYSYVRTQSLARRIGRTMTDLTVTRLVLTHPSERALAARITRFSESIAAMERELLPNRLTDYLYALACDFNAFFRDCRVEGDPQQESRLLLSLITGQVIKQGLEILGIPVVDRM